MAKKYIFPLLFGLFLLVGCKDETSVDPVADYKPVLQNAAEAVIVQTYKNLDDRMAQLASALQKLETNPGTPNLEAARQAWRDARQPWEQSEGFLFGPVEHQGIDPAMDSWPVNDVDLDNILASPAALTKEYLDAQAGTVKGFHTIEYLLFGINATKTIDQFDARQFEYLRACAQSLNGETSRLYSAWALSGQNFSKNLLEAGNSASIYPSQKSALQELINGLVTIADEVANGKINDPFTQQNVELEESRFSANSKIDFADNIRSIRNIYLGSLNGSDGTGLSSIVKTKNAVLDQKIRSLIDASILKIETIPGTFTTAIFDQGPAVEAARNKVRDLQDALQSELLPFFNNL